MVNICKRKLMFIMVLRDCLNVGCNCSTSLFFDGRHSGYVLNAIFFDKWSELTSELAVTYCFPGAKVAMVVLNKQTGHEEHIWSLLILYLLLRKLQNKHWLLSCEEKEFAGILTVTRQDPLFHGQCQASIVSGHASHVINKA